jgi:nucleoside-diphosphate-sugar epimerase
MFAAGPEAILPFWPGCILGEGTYDMRVFIGGVSGSTGRLLAERLLAAPDIDEVIGLDAAACYPPVAGLRFVRAGWDQAGWRPLLAQVDAAVLLIGVRWPLRWGVRGGEMALVDDSRRFINAVVAARVPHLIVAQSAALYGSWPTLPPTAANQDEISPIRGHVGSAYARARAFIEDYLDTLPENGYNGLLTRLRSAWICGPHHLALLHQLFSGPVRACGYDERVIQVVHEDDFVAAVELALRQGCPGVYHVCPDAGMMFEQVASVTGDSHDCQPLPWLVLRAWWGWRFGRRPSPPAWVRSLYMNCPAAGTRLRAAGWSPRYSSREALSAALEIFRSGK